MGLPWRSWGLLGGLRVLEVRNILVWLVDRTQVGILVERGRLNVCFLTDRVIDKLGGIQLFFTCLPFLKIYLWRLRLWF